MFALCCKGRSSLAAMTRASDRHSAQQCPFSGAKETSRFPGAMSAFDPKRTSPSCVVSRPQLDFVSRVEDRSKPISSSLPQNKHGQVRWVASNTCSGELGVFGMPTIYAALCIHRNWRFCFRRRFAAVAVARTGRLRSSCGARFQLDRLLYRRQCWRGLDPRPCERQSWK